MAHTLWLVPGETAPPLWAGPTLMADLRKHVFKPDGGLQTYVGEHVWVRRRELGREVVGEFFRILEGRREAEALAPFREGLEDALAQRSAGWAFADLVAAEAMEAGALVAVLEGGDLARLAAGWLQDRPDSACVDDAGQVTPITPPSVRAPRPLGDAPAEHILAMVEDASLPPALEPEGTMIAITSLSHGTQSVTLAPVVRALREAEPVLLINTAPAALPGMPDYAGLEEVKADPQLMKLVAANTLRLWANKATPDTAPSLRRLLMRVLQIDLPRLVALDQVLARAVGNAKRKGARPPHLVGTTDSTYTSDFLRRRAPRHGVGRTVVQNAFVSGSARYTRPDTDRLLTVDAWSSDVIATEFGVDPGSMEVVGSVRYAHLPSLRGRRPEGEHGKASWLERHGFGPDAHLFAFAAQPSAHSSGPLALLDAMESAFGDSAEAAFALRLHPKEFPDVVDAVKARLAKTSLQAALDTRPIEDFLLSADAVITEFSNVGLEAGILGVPLLILKMPGSPAFPPLDAFGIGRTVESYADAAAALRELMEVGADAAGFPDTSGEFAERNPGLYAGDTVERILKSIAEARKV